MRRVVVECSKDGKEWIAVAEFVTPETGIIIPDPEFQEEKIGWVKLGYRYWRERQVEGNNR